MFSPKLKRDNYSFSVSLEKATFFFFLKQNRWKKQKEIFVLCMGNSFSSFLQFVMSNFPDFMQYTNRYLSVKPPSAIYNINIYSLKSLQYYLQWLSTLSSPSKGHCFFFHSFEGNWDCMNLMNEYILLLYMLLCTDGHS